ncbi:MAG: hypothetical protein ACRD50_03555 [Candidatus Acidiferrales bacterium]
MPSSYLLEIEPLDLGEDVQAVGLDLAEFDEVREPVRGADAAVIWSRVLPAVAGPELWALDFFSHLDRLREYCLRHQIEFRDAASRTIVIPSPDPAPLAALFEQFQRETFGARAGGPLLEGDAALENELSRRGADAYHAEFRKYFFCAICDFEEGSLTFLSKRLWPGEILRRVRPVLTGLNVEVHLPV